MFYRCGLCPPGRAVKRFTIDLKTTTLPLHLSCTCRSSCSRLQHVKQAMNLRTPWLAPVQSRDAIDNDYEGDCYGVGGFR